MQVGTDTREMRALVIAATTRIEQNGAGWRVPSQSGRGTYHVTTGMGAKRCTCPDHELRAIACKHILAVEITVRREGGSRASMVTVTKTTEVYDRSWKAYNAAQCEEKTMFAPLLADLCRSVPQPDQKRGRPRVPLSDIVFASTYRIYDRISSRRFTSAMTDLAERGYLSHVPHFNSLTNYLREPGLEPILSDLIANASLPLTAIETDFAMDATGFTTSQFDGWYDHRHRDRSEAKRVWMKLHIATGVRSNIVTAAQVTPANHADSTQFEALLRTTAKGFTIGQVSADKGYLSRANVDAVARLNATPFIPFKSNNVVPRPGDDSAWARMWHECALHKADWLANYHKRSNVETTFSVIKRKFGGTLLSKSEQGQINEVLCKVLAHNLCVLNAAMHELGIEPNFG